MNKPKIEYMDAQPFAARTAKTDAQRKNGLKILHFIVECVSKTNGVDFGSAFDTLAAEYPQVIKKYSTGVK